jgi:hypothetical protein
MQTYVETCAQAIWVITLRKLHYGTLAHFLLWAGPSRDQIIQIANEVVLLSQLKVLESSMGRNCILCGYYPHLELFSIKYTTSDELLTKCFFTPAWMEACPCTCSGA